MGNQRRLVVQSRLDHYRKIGGERPIQEWPWFGWENGVEGCRHIQERPCVVLSHGLVDLYDHGISGVTFFRGGIAFTVATNGEGSICSHRLLA